MPATDCVCSSLSRIDRACSSRAPNRFSIVAGASPQLTRGAISARTASKAAILICRSIFRDLIKKEFVGKSFQVSQAILYSNSAQTSYDNQLKNFSSLLNLVTNVYQKIISDQETFVQETKKYEISNNNLIISDNVQSELKAGIVELILDGLCWIEPKILDKKEAYNADALAEFDRVQRLYLCLLDKVETVEHTIKLLSGNLQVGYRAEPDADEDG